MRVGKCSLRHANSWSPPSRDPRYSRRTPDKLLALLAAAIGVRGGAAGDTTLWAARILHAKARKCLVYDNKRAHLLSVLKKKAEAADTAPANTTLEVNVDSSVYEAPLWRFRRLCLSCRGSAQSLHLWSCMYCWPFGNACMWSLQCMWSLYYRRDFSGSCPQRKRNRTSCQTKRM